MSEATPVIEQLVNDGLLTPGAAVVLLNTDNRAAVDYRSHAPD